MNNQKQVQPQAKKETTTQPATKKLFITVRKLDKVETTDWRHIVYEG